MSVLLALAAGCAQGEISSDGGGSGSDAGGAADGASDTTIDTGEDECSTAADCPSGPNATAVCDNGECELDCDSGYGDADDSAANGCECETSEGGTEVCDQKDNDCDGEVDEDFDLSSDPDHCGMCGNACEYPNAEGVCNQGVCELGSCKDGYKNCDGSAANGCEIDVTSNDQNCGSCGNTCVVGNADRSCQGGTCTELQCNDPYADCNGQTNDGCEVNTDTSVSNCGMCGNACSYPNGIPSCSGGNCQMDGCQSGYHDLNGDTSDGCEYACTQTSPTDRPDGSATDANCDGIDGNLSQSVFVAKPSQGGDDSNSGRSRSSPVASLSKGLDVAENCSSPCDVLMAAGTYTGSVTIPSGVEVFGGYDGNSWARDITANTTIIEGTAKRTITVDSPSARVTIGGVTVRAADFTGSGKSTYGVWASDTNANNFVIKNSVVEGGDAGKGSDGSDGSPGADGNDGSSATGNYGGFGGYSSCGAGGGNGGDGNMCPTESGNRGSAGGDSTGGGFGGLNGLSKCGGCNDSANDGYSGTSGYDGSTGVAPASVNDKTGSFSGNFWSGSTGSAGTSGDHGRGGGGGGAGGTDDDSGLFCPGGVVNGGGGGGGGAGGCGGQPGSPGNPGGGSFAIALLDAGLDIRSTTVRIGRGGDGGAGGDGGDGGAGGVGDSGTDLSSGSEAGDGGDGADGGDGGGGPGGPGGCGGPAIGIAKVGSSSTQTSNISFANNSPSRGGSGGAGGIGGYTGGNAGSSQAPDGPSGCDGAVHKSYSY